MPDPERIKGCLTTTMYEVELCPKSPQYVPLSEVSSVMKDAVIVSEDGAFYQHSGFDWHEIQDSLKTSLKTQHLARGASTISQQLVKNVFLSKDRTLTRKIQEAYLTWQLEKILSKGQILERYLNVVEFGPNLYGIKAAAQFYFKKSPAQINLLEAAYLAHLLPNPRVYSQGFFKNQLTKFSHQRIMAIVERLEAYKRVSTTQEQAAKEYIDSFPWTGLDSMQGALLKGEQLGPLLDFEEIEDLPEITN
jgi:monofunctional biosynthetic peptidoglycan transglycosylase